MTSADVLVDAFGRIRETVHGVLRRLTPEQLGVRLDADANTIAWLVWHLTRIQDDHVAGAAGIEQVWTAGGWAARFGLPFEPSATGYGQRSEDVAAVQVDGADLLGYHDAAHAQTMRYVEQLTGGDLDRVVDDSWDPPVTLGVRLVSVISDNLQHVGQAAFIRGVLLRR
jgi:Protein of unknown function (DUF664)